MGRLIIFPTDTVYGIGCSIFDVDNIKRIYEIKKRDYAKPLACLCANLEQIESIAEVDDNAKKLINKFLPGALTLILKAKAIVREKINYNTIGVRIPNCQIALDILRSNGPMLTTSVNDSGQTPINEYEEIVTNYSHLVDEIYKADELSSNVSSTVVKIDDDSVVVLREGTIKAAEINNVLGV